MQFLAPQKVAFNTSENFLAPEFGSHNTQAPKAVSAKPLASEFEFSASIFKPDKAPIFKPNEISSSNEADQKMRLAVKCHNSDLKSALSTTCTSFDSEEFPSLESPGFVKQVSEPVPSNPFAMAIGSNDFVPKAAAPSFTPSMPFNTTVVRSQAPAFVPSAPFS